MASWSDAAAPALPSPRPRARPKAAPKRQAKRRGVAGEDGRPGGMVRVEDVPQLGGVATGNEPDLRVVAVVVAEAGRKPGTGIVEGR